MLFLLVSNSFCYVLYVVKFSCLSFVILAIIWILELYLGDICIQNFHLGRYNFEYTVGNLVLGWHMSGAIKRVFRPYIRWYTTQNENFEYGYPHFNANLQFLSKIGAFNLHKTVCHSTKLAIINEVKPGCVSQSVTCLATDACLTADPGIESWIPVRSHTFVEIDHEN